MINIDKQTLGTCPCGPDIDDSKCFNLRAGIWRNATIAADTGLDAQGLTYRAAMDPSKASDGSFHAWEAMFIAITFHDAAPRMKKKGAEGSEYDADVGSLRSRNDTSSCAEHRIEGRELCLPVVKPGDMQVSSNVMVLPDTVPFDCYRVIVWKPSMSHKKLMRLLLCLPLWSRSRSPRERAQLQLLVVEVLCLAEYLRRGNGARATAAAASGTGGGAVPGVVPGGVTGAVL